MSRRRPRPDYAGPVGEVLDASLADGDTVGHGPTLGPDEGNAVGHGPLAGLAEQDLRAALISAYAALATWSILSGPLAFSERAVHQEPELETTTQRSGYLAFLGTLAVAGGALLFRGRRGLAAAATAGGLGLVLFTLSRFQVGRAAADGRSLSGLRARRMARAIVADPLGVATLRSALGLSAQTMPEAVGGPTEGPTGRTEVGGPAEEPTGWPAAGGLHVVRSGEDDVVGTLS